MDPTIRTAVMTGASGFIGSHLARHFASRGWRVIGLCRGAANRPPMPRVTFREFSLPDGIREEDLAGGDVLIHCAYVPFSRRHPDADAINIGGTERLLALARRHRYRKFVFLSSLAADDRALSHYGRHKRALETIFDLDRDLIVRPGLTLGNGGLARAMVDVVRRHRIVPLIGSGRQPVYTVGVDDLCRAIGIMVDRDLSGRYAVAAPEPVTMRELYLGLARKAGIRCLLVPVPYFAARLAAGAAERLGLELPITTENLLGLRQLRRFDVASDLRALGLDPRPFPDALDAMDVS